MAFQFAYSLNTDGYPLAIDLPLDTTANYGVNGAIKGDLVINSGGLLRRAGVAATVASVAGVLMGGEFLGLVAQGQPYAATNASQSAAAVDTTKNPNGVGKVATNKSIVYRVPAAGAGTATNANIGSTFAIAVDANGDQTIDLANTAGSTQLVKLVNFTDGGKTLFVTLV